MDEETARFLTSLAGRTELDSVANLPADDARRVLVLRKAGHSLSVASGLVEVAAARKRAARRFADADQLFFTAEMLAQASSPAVSAYHAECLSYFATVADLGCGAGMDCIAFAQAGAQVTAWERDPVRLIFARANAEARGVEDRITFRLGDVTREPWEADAVYWDPSRRNDAGRVSRYADRYEPPLSFLQTIRHRVRGGCVKLSPALPDDVLNELDGQIQFLSEGRECKEACLRFGAAAQQGIVSPPSAVLLPEKRYVPQELSPLPVAPVLGTYIHDPDPALIRANALGTLHLPCPPLPPVFRVSADDAYVTSDAPLDPPRLGLSYRVWETLTYRPRDVAARLRARNIGRLVVKKRHFKQEPDVVVKELGLSGKGDEATLILVRDGKRFLAVLCEPIEPTLREPVS